MQESLLTLHILASAAWLGGALVTLFLGPRMAEAGGEASAAWARTGNDLAMKYFNPATILTLLTGIGLVLNGDAFDWSDAFVEIGIGAIIVAAVIGMGFMAPTRRKLLDALDAQDFGQVGRMAGKLRWSSIAIVGVLIVTIVFMVLKTGTA